MYMCYIYRVSILLWCFTQYCGSLKQMKGRTQHRNAEMGTGVIFGVGGGGGGDTAVC